MLILERPLDNPVISGPQFIEELDPQARLFFLVPVENRLDIEVGLWLRNESVLAHRLFLPKWSRTS
jgi:hypothetical protein